MAKKYVTDLIGDDYKNWKRGDWILLSYPTGLGKTHFILHTLLRHAASMGRHLVYYCNRKFLSLQFDAIVKKQLLEELGKEGEVLSHYLHVRTYQNAELTNSYPNVYNTGKQRDYYGDLDVECWWVEYYVFDEAHYPVADGQVNPGTVFWLDKKEAFRHSQGVCVFMTATPEPFLLFRKCLEGDIIDDLKMDMIARVYAKRAAAHGKKAVKWVKIVSPQYGEMEAQHNKLLRHHQYLIDRGFVSVWDQPRLLEERVASGQILEEEYKRVIEECQDPFRGVYERLEEIYSEELEHHYRLDISPAEYYSYVEEHYFSEWSQMAERIALSAEQGERWLIFVRRKEDGDLLQNILGSYHCSSVVINARNTRSYDGKRKRRRSPRNQALDALVWHQELGCKILIGTSVLDNGISLHAEGVDHLVLCQPGKTSFLQMLGRVRVKEGQKLKVYIQRQTSKAIKGYIDQCKQDILFLVRWQLSGRLVVNQGFSSGLGGLPMKAFKDETEKLRKERLQSEQRPRYFVTREDGKEEVNQLVMCQLLGSLYDMEVRAKQNGDGSSDQNYYLRHQLSWIGKTYDPTRWVDYQETQDGLMEYLGQMESFGQEIDKAGQTEFRRVCLKLLLDLRQPKPYFDKVKVRFSLEQKKYPGMKVLNTAFADAQIPYVIKNKQKGKSRQTNWYIEKTHLAKESEHPLQDAPKLTDSQDTSDGSCSPSSGIPVG